MKPEPATRRPQIVLVEDNPADVGLVREALDEHKVPCRLTVITNGERAVRFIDEIDAHQLPPPQLVIIDLNLPKRPGSVVLEHLRASGQCRSVPVIVLTSSDNQKDKDDVSRFSPLRYIRKPTRLDEFIRLGAVFRDLLYPLN